MTAQRQVYSVASHGGEYVYYVIEAVMLLNHDEPRNTTVAFLPFEPPFANLYRRLRSLLRKRPEPDPDSPADRPGLYHELWAGKTVRIDRASYGITLQRLRLPRSAAIITWLRAMRQARRIWRACHEPEFQPLLFLRSSYKGAQIGDLAASTWFRLNPYAHHLKGSFHLFFMLWWCCWLIDITEKLVHAPGTGGYAITPEPNYVHSAPYRYLRTLGCRGLDIYQPNTALSVLDDHDDIAVPRRLRPTKERGVITPDFDELVTDYFQQRLHAAPTMLWYMSHGQNDNASDALCDIDGQPVVTDKEALYAVVFLHSFVDSQYFFGVDGFTSLADWTHSAIESCLANSSFQKVFIKPHPNADYDGQIGDGRALDRIVSRYRRHPRVVVLAPTTSVVAFCNVARLVGLTHHGSVAEELVYLGHPVIASTFAWWSNGYRFAKLWSTPEEMRALIAAQTDASWQPPTPQEKAELYRYLAEFRFREVPCDRTFPAFILARLRKSAASDAAVRLRLEEETAYSRELEKLKQDDVEFEQLLEQFQQLAVEPPSLWPMTRAG